MKLPLKMILQLLLEASILRMVLGTECSSPLGMISGHIREDQLSASSEYGSSWGPNEARLDNNRAWYPSSYTQSEWLQIDLINRTSITGIQTQGDVRRGLFSSTHYYVTLFKLFYSDDGATWNTFRENSVEKIFTGNSDGDGVMENSINPPIRSRFIRLMAVAWRRGIAFRLELLGCELEETTTRITTTTTSATSTLMTTKIRTSQSTRINTYSVSSTKGSAVVTAVSTDGVTHEVPQRSTRPSLIVSPTSSYFNSSGNSDGFVANQAGVPGAIIGGAAAAVVAVVIIAVAASIFYFRRRRSKNTDEKEQSPQADEGTVDNIYYGGVAFAANGNASTNGNVSIGQSEGMVDNNLYTYAGATNGHVTTDQSEGMVDNHLYAGTSTTNGTLSLDQSEGTVDNHLYAGTG
ncbi:uncharacterized protein LOC144917279 [Branchiostoma floridae x Branchiostoma belcheri]